jgi:hypothetical protein
MKSSWAVIGVFLSSVLNPCFGDEAIGPLEFYRGGEHSTVAHLKIEGPAAERSFEHLKKAQETRNAEQNMRIRKGKNIECVEFETEVGHPYRCYLHLTDEGILGAGYAPQ